MKKYFLPFIVVASMSFVACDSNTSKKSESNTSYQSVIENKDSFVYDSPTLKMHTIAPNTYLYTCYLETTSFGKVDCNGVVFISNNEAVVLDAPTSDSVSMQLIDLIQNQLKATVKAVVVNHFHEDCIGGLKAFHDLKIPSYANALTIQTLQSQNHNVAYIPKNGFEIMDTLQIGKSYVINAYLGKGHTADNIVSFIPETNVLFGGCLVKALDANKGNLADADTLVWSQTISKVQHVFSDAKIVIPGHGAYGDTALLGYTLQLFKQK